MQASGRWEIDFDCCCFFYLSSFLASVVTDLKDGLFRPNWISWSGSVCTNTKRIIWKMPRKDTRRYDSLSALAIRKWHNNNFHPLETSHYLSPGRGRRGGGESEDFDVWCKSDWFPSKALIPLIGCSLAVNFLYSVGNNWFPLPFPLKTMWPPQNPSSSLSEYTTTSPPQPFSFSVQSCELVVADSRENVSAFDSCLLNWINGDIFCVLLLQPKNAHKLMAPPPNHLIYTGNGAREKNLPCRDMNSI